MLKVQNVLVSDDVIEEKFICDLSKCKGACCVEGESGAPLEDDEAEILEQIYPLIEPYLSEKGKKAIKKQGKWIVDSDGDKVTPLVGPEKECAYTIFENGMALCGIEKAHREGKVEWAKPVSCHLYPVRITEHKKFTAVNYEKWDICKPACACGEKLQVPVYKFVKTALVRKFGEEWYAALDSAAKYIENNGTNRQ